MKGSKRVTRAKARRAQAVNTRQQAARIAVGYTRVSTDEQAENGRGLEIQERAIRAFAESQGYELTAVIADPGISGATKPAERPGYDQVLQLLGAKTYVEGSDPALFPDQYARERPAGVLLVWKFDRLARSIAYAVGAVAHLVEHQVDLRSVTEPIDTATPMGRTLFAVLAGLAEQERQGITERTFGGRKVKASHGGFAGGRAPYGYRKGTDGELVMHAEEALVVRTIFNWRRLGWTLAAIAGELNALAVLAPKGRHWHPGRIAYILDNPKYRGDVEYLFTWNGAAEHVLERGTHQAIV